MNHDNTNPNRGSFVKSNRLVIFLAGIITGAAGWLALWVWFQPIFGSNEVFLAWQQVQLGMPESEVVELLGTPSSQTGIGENFPRWIESQVPKGFEREHRVATYVIGWSNLLLIFYDSHGKVVFVSYAPT